MERKFDLRSLTIFVNNVLLKSTFLGGNKSANGVSTYSSIDNLQRFFFSEKRISANRFLFRTGLRLHTYWRKYLLHGTIPGPELAVYYEIVMLVNRYAVQKIFRYIFTVGEY